jgi:hypothetical protein
VETPEDPGIDKPAHEGDVIRAGSIEAHVLHTPGHTPGSISLYIPLESKVIPAIRSSRAASGARICPAAIRRRSRVRFRASCIPSRKRPS